jgi:protease-4
MSETEQPTVDATPATNPPKDQIWERDLLNRLAFATLNEQRRARRWGIFFKILLFAYLIAMVFVVKPNLGQQLMGTAEEFSSSKHVALVELQGVISDDSQASADIVITGLRAAFADANTVGVILRINSPGGSPVQAGYINDEIKRLREKHPEIPLYAVITDMCASGGYYIAAAADKIYADKASIVGSIGVIMSSFGFVDALQKLGIERRLLTAGEHKAFLDPFSPQKDTDMAHVQTLLNNIHEQFINVVKTGRGDRLKVAENPELFSGLVWTGEQAVQLGLVDALGSSGFVAREVLKTDKLVDFTAKPNYFEKFAERFGTTMANQLQQSALFGGKVQ